MKAAKDTAKEFCDPARKVNILGRNQTRLELWEERLKDPIIDLDKALKCPENPHQGRSLKGFCEEPRKLHYPAVGWVQEFCKRCGKTVVGRRLALLGPVGQRALAHGVHSLERSREVWAAWRALFLPY